jgi:chromosome partitioning protein
VETVKSVALLSHKGGTGKTTMSLHLGVAAALANYLTAIIDLDPQASATEWGDSREAETPAVVSAQASRLAQVMQTAQAGGVDIVLIDTAPLSETTARAAARAADLILVPCRPAILNLRAIKATRDLVKLADTPAFVVLNAVPPRGTLDREARQAVALHGLETAPMHWVQRNAFMNSLKDGLTAQEAESRGKAAQEVAALFDWVCTRVNL